ncbi:hypothetical protein BP6252_11796 [Coleophoma cylindrospora]|uniref:Uncharacterized protein n=1 Tax=Coleophoma cylindrospora TaxID=1849047 RepID=A0A3D8QKK4_9HELO|nr:hypothetical protein BP6252_11796 [Coleophoma cylindrospora]
MEEGTWHCYILVKTQIKQDYPPAHPSIPTCPPTPEIIATAYRCWWLAAYSIHPSWPKSFALRRVAATQTPVPTTSSPRLAAWEIVETPSYRPPKPLGQLQTLSDRRRYEPESKSGARAGRGPGHDVTYSARPRWGRKRSIHTCAPDFCYGEGEGRAKERINQSAAAALSLVASSVTRSGPKFMSAMLRHRHS